MNDRQKQLLRILLTETKETFNIVHLADRLACAEKTVRNDLKRMDKLLDEYSSAHLKRQPGIGITLEINEAERSAIFQRLLSNEPKTSEDRITEIAYHLLVNDKAVTLQELAKSYYVPRATIKKDMDAIANWLKVFDLELISKPRIGNVVQGNEFNKRSALAHLSQLASSASSNKNYVLDLFLDYEITTVKKALNDMQHRYSIAFTDGAIESLLVHALIMIKRTRQKSPVFIPQDEKDSVHQYKEYQHASGFFENLESVFRITFPEDERIYFTWHLISSKKREGGTKDTAFSDKYLMEIVTALTSKLSKLTLFSFEKDSVLAQGLAVHIHSVINRIKYGFPITNPLLSDIKKMYPYLFNMVVLAMEEIKENYNLDVPEDEAAYLVLHFQASIERLDGSRQKRKRTLIVCHMGVGMSHLLEAKLEQHYQDIEIVDCIGKADVRECLKNHAVDFIITTVALERINIPHVVISPLLEAKDQEKLNQFVEDLEHKQGGSGEETQLSSLIRGDLVHLDVDKEHPFEVVEMLGDVLFQKGFICKEFVHSALVREGKSATSIGGSIAIPHGNPSMVNQSAIAVAVLKKPVEWGTEQVSIVFMLAISNDDKGLNRGAVKQIVSISDNPKFVQALIAAKSVKAFLDRID
ncbi:BglG family transcription antiterminator [Aquibacillus albus]|uniref:Activator of the mannose operon (Transcriptional antiterminator) n=1 Tax=Aquibacillus albus TaxID=1168171 RepID=A0ABS2N5Y8_9BACI|nr:BglG family transcription antiterminator [Aquibacillus albus]MBM7573562.1 activator of the mannose operon (transcriptional antiterminator) [Aquibacillus albus]